MSRSFPSDLARHVHSKLNGRSSKFPSETALTKLFETLYFASLKREEDQPISCRIAFVDRNNPDPDPPIRVVANRWQCCPLGHEIPLNVRSLVKLSSAADPWASTLAVDVGKRGELFIWGMIDQSVHHSTFMVREGESGPEMPGLFQATIQGIGEIAVYDSFLLVGSLTQDVLVKGQQKVFHAGPVRSRLADYISPFRQNVKDKVGPELYEERGHWDASMENLWVSVLCRILIGIQRYHHGGAILISDSAEGLNAKYPLRYKRLSEALLRVAACQIENTAHSDEIHDTYLNGGLEDLPMDLWLDEEVTGNDLRETNDEITGCVRFIASLARVDGLIWLNSRLCLNGFGTEITIREDPANVVLASNPQASKIKKLDLNHYGTRHRSMLRYCGANPSSLGFIVSQDGDVRAVACHSENTVLWDNIQIKIG
jgi:hypothetical protein